MGEAGKRFSRGMGHTDQQLKQLASVRSTSAPPVMPNDFIKTASSPVNTEAISPQDPRLDPAYYAYYYSQRPLDPRLPPPRISPYTHYSAFLAASQQQNSSSLSLLGVSPGTALNLPHFDFDDNGSLHHNSVLANEEEDKWPRAASPGSKDAYRPKSLVDKIQSDFPRTPSPIYQKSKAEEAMAAAAAATAGHSQSRVMLQPQPQHGRSQLLAHQQSFGNATRPKDVPHQQMYYGTDQLADTMGELNLYKEFNNYNEPTHSYDKRGTQREKT